MQELRATPAPGAETWNSEGRGTGEAWQVSKEKPPGTVLCPETGGRGQATTHMCSGTLRSRRRGRGTRKQRRAPLPAGA